MKKLTKIIVLILSVALLVGVIAIVSSANDKPVKLGDETFETFEDAVLASGDNPTISFVGPYTATDVLNITKDMTIDFGGQTVTAAAGFLNISPNVTVTVKGVGTLNLVGSFADYKTANLIIDPKTNLTVNVGSIGGGTFISAGAASVLSLSGKIAIKTDAYFQTIINLEDGALLDMNGATLTHSINSHLKGGATNMLVIKGADDITINDSTVTNDHGAIISFQNDPTAEDRMKLTVNNSTLSAMSDTEAWSDGHAYNYAIATFSNKYVDLVLNDCSVSAIGRMFQGGSGNCEKIPNSFVYLTRTDVTLRPSPAATGGSPKIFESINAIIDGGSIDFSLAGDKSIAMRTRRWNPEDGTGILIKKGTAFKSNPYYPTLPEGTYYEAGANGYIAYEAGCALVSRNVLNDDHSISAMSIVSLATVGPEIYVSPISSATTNFETHELTTFDGPSNSYLLGSSFANVGNGCGTRYGTLSVVSENGNKFVKFEHIKGSPIPAAPYVGLNVVDTVTVSKAGEVTALPQSPLMEYDFITYDFDIASTTLDENGNIAYPSMTVLPIVRFAQKGADGKYSVSQAQLAGNSAFRISYLDSARGDNLPGYYLHDGYGIDGASDLYRLPDTPGIWTHITMVVEIDRSGVSGNYNFTNTKIHTYVNGEYFTTKTNFLSTAINSLDEKDAKTISLDEFRCTMNIPAEDYSHSVAFDNTAVCFYGKGYAGDLVGVKSDCTKSLMGYSDVVFGYDYVYSAPNSPIASIDGKNYFSEEAFYADIKEGSEIKLYSDLVAPIYANFEFTVDTQGGKYSFTVISEDYSVIDQDSDGVYEISLSASVVPVIFDIDNVLGLGLDLLEINAAEGTIPSLDTSLPENLRIGNKYYNLRGWTYEYGGTDPEKLVPVTRKDVNDGELLLYPVISEISVAYTVTDSEGNETIYADFSSFFEKFAQASSGSVIKLYSDLVVKDSESKISLTEENKVVYFDLNGCDIKRTNSIKKPIFIGIYNDGIDLYVYSSLPGSEVFISSVDSSGVVRGAAFISVEGTNNVSVNIGEVSLGGNTYSGDNIAFYCPIVANFQAESTSASAGTGNVLNVKGGTYARTASDSYGLFICRDGVDFNFTDASLISTTGSTIIGIDDRYDSRGTITVDGCLAYAVSGSPFTTCLPNTSFVIRNSVIVGNLNFSGGGSVTLGDGNIIKDGAEFTDAVKTGDGIEYVRLSKTLPVYYKYNTFSYTDNAVNESSYSVTETTVDVTFVTMTADVSSGNFATVNWCDALGNTLLTEYWLPGSVAENDGTIVPGLDIGNDWYEVGFGGWEGDLTVSEAKTYNFKPVMSAVKADIDGVKFNISLYSYFMLNVYIPTHSMPENVTDLKIYGDANYTTPLSANKQSKVLIKGDEYTQLSNWPGATAVSSISYYISFKVDGTEVRTVVTASMPSYFKAAMAQISSDEEKTLIMNIVRYCNECRKAFSLSDNSVYAELIENYSSYLTDISGITIGEDELAVDYSTLSSYISGASYIYGSYESRFAFRAAEGIINEDMTSSYRVKVTATHGDGKVETYSTKIMDDGEGNLCFASNYLPMSCMNNPVTVSVYNSNNECLATGTYSFGAYINGIKNSDTYYNLAMAFYAASLSASDYIK